MAMLPLNKTRYKQLAEIIKCVPDAKLAAQTITLYIVYLMDAEEQQTDTFYCTAQAAAYKLGVSSAHVRMAKKELVKLGLVLTEPGKLGVDGICKRKACVKLLQP